MKLNTNIANALKTNKLQKKELLVYLSLTATMLSYVTLFTPFYLTWFMYVKMVFVIDFSLSSRYTKIYAHRCISGVNYGDIFI